MADSEIAGLTAAGTITGTELVHIVQSGNSRKSTVAEIAPATPAASDTVAGKIEVADQSEMESASSTTRAVTPGRQHFHPSAAKFWGFVTVSGGTPTLQTSYNVTGITDTATGRLTVTIGTDFSSANWASFCEATVSSSNDAYVQTTSKAAGSVEIRFSEGSSLVDPTNYSFGGYGDQ